MSEHPLAFPAVHRSPKCLVVVLNFLLLRVLSLNQIPNTIPVTGGPDNSKIATVSQYNIARDVLRVTVSDQYL